MVPELSTSAVVPGLSIPTMAPGLSIPLVVPELSIPLVVPELSIPVARGCAGWVCGAGAGQGAQPQWVCRQGTGQTNLGPQPTASPGAAAGGGDVPVAGQQSWPIPSPSGCKSTPLIKQNTALPWQSHDFNLTGGSRQHRVLIDAACKSMLPTLQRLCTPKKSHYRPPPPPAGALVYFGSLKASS